MPERSGYAVGQPRGDFAFCHNRPVFHTRRIHQVDRVAVTAKGAGSEGNIVGENPVAVLASQLHARVLDDIVGLCRKTDDESGPIIAALRDARQDIWVLGKAEHWWTACVFFQFVKGGALDPPI